MYTIGEISNQFNLPISTLRYYDKEGLLPNILRISGIRKFSDKDIETIRVIECLKKSGLEIKDIKNFMNLVQQGSSTYNQRKNLFEKQKALVQDEIANLQRTLAMLEYKCWYYEEALKDGDEHRLSQLSIEDMPEDIQNYYLISHSK